VLAGCPCSKESQQHSGLYQQTQNQEIKGSDYPLALGTFQTASRIACPVLRLPIQERHQQTEQRAIRIFRRLEHWPYEERRRIGLVQPEEEPATEGRNSSFPVPVKRSSRRQSQAVYSDAWQ